VISIAENVFESLKEIADLKTEIMSMKYEADAVEKELKNKK